MPDDVRAPSPLTDGVVVLDRYRADDVDAHLAGEDEETARRFGWWPARSTPETVTAAFAAWEESWRADGPVRTFAVRLVDGGALVGGCELRLAPDGGAVDASYWTGAAHRGRGHATRALRLLVAYASSVGLTEVRAEIAADNHASRHVSESAGLTLAATTGDLVTYRLALPGNPRSISAPPWRVR